MVQIISIIAIILMALIILLTIIIHKFKIYGLEYKHKSRVIRKQEKIKYMEY